MAQVLVVFICVLFKYNYDTHYLAACTIKVISPDQNSASHVFMTEDWSCRLNSVRTCAICNTDTVLVQWNGCNHSPDYQHTRSAPPPPPPKKKRALINGSLDTIMSSHPLWWLGRNLCFVSGVTLAMQELFWMTSSWHALLTARKASNLQIQWYYIM